MKPLTSSILPQIALNQNNANTFTNNSSNFNGLQAELNNAPAKSWWVCVSGLKVQPKHVGLTTCDRYQQTL